MATDRALAALLEQHSEIDAMVSLDLTGEPAGVAGAIENPHAVSDATIESLESIHCALGLLGLGHGQSWSFSTDNSSWYSHREGDQLLVGRGPRQHNPAGVLGRVFARQRR